MMNFEWSKQMMLHGMHRIQRSKRILEDHLDIRCKLLFMFGCLKLFDFCVLEKTRPEENRFNPHKVLAQVLLPDPDSPTNASDS